MADGEQHIFIHFARDPETVQFQEQVLGQLRSIIGMLQTITMKEQAMAKTLQEMIDQANITLEQVKKNEDLDESIIALVHHQADQMAALRQQLTDAGTDPAKLQELAALLDQLSEHTRAEGEKAAEAVRANTEAA